MNRLVMLFALGAALTACNKPTPESCRKAMLNMEHILGTDNLNGSKNDLEGDVRQCRGGSTKEAVECASLAQTKEDLVKCDFYKPRDKTDDKPADKPATDDKK
jgi:hypothetical protein